MRCSLEHSPIDLGFPVGGRGVARSVAKEVARAHRGSVSARRIVVTPREKDALVKLESAESRPLPERVRGTHLSVARTLP